VDGAAGAGFGAAKTYVKQVEDQRCLEAGPVHWIARTVLGIAGLLIGAGGLFDLLTPKLPQNLAAACAGNQRAEKLMRELLRALGGALAAIGAAILAIVIVSRTLSGFEIALILILVAPAETINAACMVRAGSPWQYPASFVAITLIGALLAIRW
jgi:hypothetical protein